MNKYFEFDSGTKERSENDENPEFYRSNIVDDNANFHKYGRKREDSNQSLPMENNQVTEEKEEKVKKAKLYPAFDIKKEVNSFSFFDLMSLTNRTINLNLLDQRYLQPGGFFPRLILLYILHLIIIIPLQMIFLFILGTIKALKFLIECKFKICLLCFFFYYLDVFLHLSYIFCFINIYTQNHHGSDRVYYYWNCFCLGLYMLYIFVMLSISLQNISSFTEIFQLEHLKYLGFRAINLFEKRFANVRGEDDADVMKIFNHLFLDLNLDHSVFRYSNFEDRLLQIDNLNINNSINPLSFALKKNADKLGDELLIDIYRHSQQKIKKSHNLWNIILYIIIMSGIIIFKIIFPLYLIIEKDNSVGADNCFGLLAVVMFYIQMIIIIFPLIRSEDLKMRTYMLERLNDHIDISIGKINEEKADFLNEQTNVDQMIQDLKTQNGVQGIHTKNFTEEKYKHDIWDYTFQKVMNGKIDTTCMFSIETWDNCRKAAQQYDTQKSQLYEGIMLFLGVYTLYLVLVLLEVIYDVYILYPKGTAITSRFLICVYCIDFCLFVILFMNRIYYGNMYNETYLKHKFSIEGLRNIYEDLNQFYDYYINDDTQATDNPFYNFLKQRIIERKNQIKMVYHSSFVTDKKDNIKHNNIENKEINKFLESYMKKVCVSLKKLYKLVDQDSRKYSHNFLGLFESDFKNALVQLGVVMIPLVPSIYQAYYGDS